MFLLQSNPAQLGWNQQLDKQKLGQKDNFPAQEQSGTWKEQSLVTTGTYL